MVPTHGQPSGLEKRCGPIFEFRAHSTSILSFPPIRRLTVSVFPNSSTYRRRSEDYEGYAEGSRTWPRSLTAARRIVTGTLIHHVDALPVSERQGSLRAGLSDQQLNGLAREMG